MGVSTDLELTNARGGVYTYRILGAVVHEAGPLRAREDEQQNFAQIYFHDLNEQVARRQEFFPDALEDGHLQEIQTILERTNQYYRTYKTIREREVDYGSVEYIRIVL
jgi:hypothetical protein